MQQQQHGDYDPQQQKWFCGYWLSREEWFDIHNYVPPILVQDKKQERAAEESEANDTEG
ncbi:MAG: hypothetical protein M3258_03275 [Thermoproteota archaeon]|jgi:hypothetical protein|nr:hypothetical protein [Thermoproteota archaeon]